MNEEQWALKFKTLIEEAKSGGFEMYILNTCCGCSKMFLRVVDQESDGEGSLILGNDE